VGVQSGYIRFACKYKWVSSVQCGGGGEVVKYCPRTTIFFRLRVSNGCRFSFDICTGEGGGHTAVVAINYPLLSIRRDKGTLHRDIYIYIIIIRPHVCVYIYRYQYQYVCVCGGRRMI